MTTAYTLQRDINGYNGFGRPFSDTRWSCTLTASTDTTVTAPLDNAVGITSGVNGPNRFLAVINFTPATALWAALNATAEVPAGDTFATTTSILLFEDEGLLVKGGDVIHFITAASDVVVSVSFYSIT